MNRQLDTEGASDPSIAERCRSITSLIEMAHRNLDPVLWDFLSGGTESEVTLRRNRAAMQLFVFRRRVLAGTTRRDPSTTLLGYPLALPVVLAPIALFSGYHPEGTCVAAKVADRVGTACFISSDGRPEIETVREHTDGPLIYQFYLDRDRERVERQLERAQRAGCTAVCITVDVTAPAHRARELPTMFTGYRGVSDEPVHEFYLRQAELRWEDLAWLRSRTKLGLVLKGVTCALDAAMAVDHGVDVVYVSNHGGRSLDHSPSTLEVLPEVVEAVGGRAEIVVDGGFVYGSDVVKALALGANAVGVGKLIGWGLGADGEAGLEHALLLLRDEILDVMTSLGVETVGDIDSACIRRSSPVTEDPWIGLARSFGSRKEDGDPTAGRW